MNNTSTDATVKCLHCGQVHSPPGPCPYVASITYYPDGTIERVEFRTMVRPDLRTKTNGARKSLTSFSDIRARHREIIELYTTGAGVREIAEAYGMSHQGIHAVIVNKAPHLRRPSPLHWEGIKK